MVSTPVAKAQNITRTGPTALDHRWTRPFYRLPSSVSCLVLQAVSRKQCARDLNADALLPSEVTKADIEAHFASHGTGEITEIKLMNGFGFIEYKDAMDARDVVPGTLHRMP